MLRLLCIASCLWAGNIVGEALLLASCGPTPPDSKPLDPDEALDTFQVVNGFRIELTAVEPYILEPIEIYRLGLAPSQHRFVDDDQAVLADENRDGTGNAAETEPSGG